ncbi:hypothetical protein JCM33374_g870 [Metschnikowia sp. JCM 33374]|nr:hypothetical protein JCM33374_g870 [Metschnikowia sp. JCM 33374]
MNRQTFLFLLLFIVFLQLPRGGVDESSEKNNLVLAQYKASLKQARSELAHGKYYSGYGNLTGLQLSYDDSVHQRNVSQWPFREYTPETPWTETQQHSLFPDYVSNKVRRFWATDRATQAGSAYMLNISSDLYGQFDIPADSRRLTPVSMPLPPYLNEYYNSYRQARYEEEKQRYEQDPENNSPPQEIPADLHKAGNITTYNSGALTVRIQPLQEVYPDLQVVRHGLDVYDDATLVYVNVEIADTPKTDRNDFGLFAVYFQDTGSLVGATRSAKFMGTQALPHFAMSETNFNRSQTLLTRLLNVADVDKDVTLDDVTTSVERAQSRCELAVFLQLSKTSYTKAELTFIDDELKLRQGLPLPKPLPKVEVANALLYSPDCGVVFEKKPDVPFGGIRAEVKLAQLRRTLLGVFLLTLVELGLFMRQAKATRTPSELSNISKLCIGLLSGYDSVVGVLMMSIMWVSDLYLICACNTVLSILLFYVFELRYFATIEASQSNERGISWWQILRGARTNADEPTTRAQPDANVTPNATPVAPGEPATGTPATPAPPANPTATVSGPSSGNVGSYFIFSLFLSFGIAMIILNAASWSVQAMRVFEYWFLLLINSYWIPQFLRNTLKNRSQSIRWEFVFGTSMVRLVPLMYLCLAQSNPFRHPRNPLLLVIVFSWIVTQIFLLYLQSVLGARFWLNSKWLPEQYNYHPVISIKDLEKGFSRDIIANLKTVPDQEVSMYESDCAICMSTLKFPVLMKESANKKSYEHLMKDVMITPCYHSFHTECLEDWMIYKLQCPVCRTALPPV